MDLQIDVTWDLVEKKSLHASRFADVRTGAKKSDRVYEVDPEVQKSVQNRALASEVAQLKKQIESMGSSKQVEPSTLIVCQCCGITDHTTLNCQVYQARTTASEGS